MIDRASSTPERARLRVLLLTYFYPPMGGAGVQRALKFTRYLPDAGIIPTVICAESAAYPHDTSLLDQIPTGTHVVRISHTPLPARILSLQQRWRPSPTDGDDRGVSEKVESRPSHSAAWRDRALNAWAALQLPDDKAGWSRQARRAAMRIASLSPFDMVFSSSPPVSAHLAARRVARAAGVPWVADFRDLWTGNPAYSAPAWRRRLDGKLEQRLLAAADGIVTVSGPLEQELAAVAGSDVATVVIPNGYDEDDFSGITPVASERGLFRIVHAGTFYGHRSPEPFLHGVRRWLESNQAVRDRLRVRFIGSIGSRFETALATFERRYPGVLERRGYVDHAQALQELVSADALLLVVGGGDSALGVATGKIFEYLRAGRPILLVGPSGSEAARLIRSLEAGEVVEDRRTDEIAAVLDRWILKGAAPNPDPARAAPYERKLLSRRLADFLYAVHHRFHAESSRALSHR